MNRPFDWIPTRPSPSSFDCRPARNSCAARRFIPRPTTQEIDIPRELIDTGTDKRFVRRDSEGQFKESDDVGKSLAQDQKRDSETKPKKGEGDKGDR